MTYRINFPTPFRHPPVMLASVSATPSQTENGTITTRTTETYAEATARTSAGIAVTGIGKYLLVVGYAVQ